MLALFMLSLAVTSPEGPLFSGSVYSESGVGETGALFVRDGALCLRPDKPARLEVTDATLQRGFGETQWFVLSNVSHAPQAELFLPPTPETQACIAALNSGSPADCVAVQGVAKAHVVPAHLVFGRHVLPGTASIVVQRRQVSFAADAAAPESCIPGREIGRVKVPRIGKNFEVDAFGSKGEMVGGAGLALAQARALISAVCRIAPAATPVQQDRKTLGTCGAWSGGALPAPAASTPR